MNCCKSTDIIGGVEDPGNVSDIRTRLGQRTVHSFTITDGLDSCNIKVWEDQQSKFQCVVQPESGHPSCCDIDMHAVSAFVT